MYVKRSCLAALVATVSAQSTNQTLTAALAGEPDLSNLTTYVQLFPDLVGQLSQAQNITILAPSNEAFSALLSSPEGAALAANDTALLQAVLSYHVLSGSFPASSIPEMPAFVPTLLDNPTFESVNGGQVVEALRSGDSVEITAGLKNVAAVTKADIAFTGGVIHVIDAVLTIPANLSTTLVAANLTSLAGALTSAGITEESIPPQGVTIFAPNNEAFQRIGSALPNLTTEQLTQILNYHIVPDMVAYSSSLSNQTARTASGAEVTIQIIGEDVFVNSAKVVVPDVLFAGGVVHVIDGVLNANASSARPNPSEATQSVAFEGASSASDVPFTSGVPTPTATFAGAEETAASSTATSESTATSSGAAVPMRTGSAGMAALVGAGALWMLV